MRNHELHRCQRSFFMDYGPLDRELSLLKPNEWWHHAETGDLIKRRNPREEKTANRARELGWNDTFCKTKSRMNHEVYPSFRETFDAPKPIDLDSHPHLFLPFISTPSFIDMRSGEPTTQGSDPWAEVSPYNRADYIGPPIDNERIPRRTRNVLTHTHVMTRGPAKPFQYAIREQKPRRGKAQTARRHKGQFAQTYSRGDFLPTQPPSQFPMHGTNPYPPHNSTQPIHHNPNASYQPTPPADAPLAPSATATEPTPTEPAPAEAP